jgi:AcrR family transcriptional regulator
MSFSFPCTLLCRERCQRTNRMSRLNAHICAIISSMARKYEMKRRAERMQETRRRITEAAIELHRTVGPARATVSAVAEKAGVQRHTYYAHFPELRDLYRACTAHYLQRNPLPDPSRWEEISGPEERLREALNEVYAYYQGNEAMLTNVLRDMPFDPVLQENNVLLFRHWEAMRDTIADAFEARGERHEALLAAVALALELQTWRTLVGQQGLHDDRAVELMVGMVRCLMRS